MSFFAKLFDRDPAPHSANEPATDHIWPADIRDVLSRHLGLTHATAKEAYDLIFDPVKGLVSVAVANGKDVHLTGLGKFTRRERTAGVMRNPGTGEPVQVPARNYPAFKVSAKWRDLLR